MGPPVGACPPVLGRPYEAGEGVAGLGHLGGIAGVRRGSRSKHLSALQCLICRVEGRLCALPLHHVCEVMRPLPVDDVDGAPPFVSGLSVVRGEPVVVVDAARLIAAGPALAGRFVLLRLEQRSVVLAVTEVLGTRAIPLDQLAQVPPLLAESQGGRHSLAQLDGELLELLDSARIIDAAASADGSRGAA